MRLILGTMVGFYVLNFWVFPLFHQILFPWDGFLASNLNPVYTGMILLAGLIVACTNIILEEVKGIKENNVNIKKDIS